MRGFVHGRLGRSGMAAILLVVAVSAVTSMAGFHAHAAELDAENHASGTGACQVCSWTDAPVLSPPACAAEASVAARPEPVADKTEAVRTLFVERLNSGRAPPVC